MVSFDIPNADGGHPSMVTLQQQQQQQQQQYQQSDESENSIDIIPQSSNLGGTNGQMRKRYKQSKGSTSFRKRSSRSLGDMANAGASMRGQAVFVRPEAEIGAMATNKRIMTKVKSWFRHICCLSFRDEVPSDGGGAAAGGAGGGTGADGGEDLEGGNQLGKVSSLQYRLEATRKFQSKGFLTFFLSCGLFESKRSVDGAIGINPNQQLAMYLHWMFRVNFLFLFSVMCIMFFAWVIFFALFIIVAGKIDADCVRIGGEPFGAAGTEFADAFALSWTTFSTVGYGSTYPALGNENESPTNCFFITFICSLESLLGVLYSGFCGAILFGKVLRIQSHAQVLFSDPIVIRYGTGGKEEHEVEADNTAQTNNPKIKKKIPCPLLEFRIVNRLYNDLGGEIMDATLNVVANVDANDSDPMDSSDRKSFAPTIDSGSYNENSSARSDTSDRDYIRASDRMLSESHLHNSFARSRFFDPLSSIIGRQEHHAIEEAGTKLVSKRIFSKMVIEAGEHPFFKRVWLARHVIDDTSPILKPRVRRLIRRNGGSWPENLCTYEAVRESLQFNQILVSLNGVSNVSASDVYAQKIYDFVDINVGYQFVNILYRDSDSVLKVDIDLLNDVREQRGGGGEPLIVDE